jgi:hypothetical protein
MARATLAGPAQFPPFSQEFNIDSQVEITNKCRMNLNLVWNSTLRVIKNDKILNCF